MKTKISLSLLLILILVISGCSPTESQTSSTKRDGLKTSASATSKLAAEPANNYSTSFKIEFSGPKPWIYQLNTRRSAKLREENLHIEGIDNASNPGDVRQVTDGTTTWMIGAGTDNECVQFPNNQGMDANYIRPDSLLPFNDLISKLQHTGDEQIAGKKAAHYGGKVASIGKWKNAKIDVWQDATTKALLKLTMHASGDDPFFNSGSGTLDAAYQVQQIDGQKINPVKGCEINIPVLKDAQKLVRLPGMASFETQTGINEVVSFYQAELAKQNWAEVEAASQSEGATILSFSRGTENVEIHLEALETGGSMVKLLFMQGK